MEELLLLYVSTISFVTLGSIDFELFSKMFIILSNKVFSFDI